MNAPYNFMLTPEQNAAMILRFAGVLKSWDDELDHQNRWQIFLNQGKTLTLVDEKNAKNSINESTILTIKSATVPLKSDNTPVK